MLHDHNKEDHESDYDNHERGVSLWQALWGMAIAVAIMAVCYVLVG